MWLVLRLGDKVGEMVREVERVVGEIKGVVGHLRGEEGEGVASR